MQEELSDFKLAIRDVLLNVMIDKNNKFEKNEYFILSQLLWAVDNYPAFGIPFTRFGILTQMGEHYFELVIRFDKDFLVLAKEGVERSHGSDSFEKEYVFFDHNDIFKKIQEKKQIQLADLHLWYEKSKQLIGEEDTKYTFEYYE